VTYDAYRSLRGFMGNAVMKRNEKEKIIARIESVRKGTESYPDLSDVVESMREEEDG
jgi:hypothetical protein